MRGSLVHRGTNRWACVVYIPQPDGTKRQKWIKFHGTRKAAGDKLAELVASVNGRTWVEPTKVTVLAYLRTWLERSVKPLLRPASYASYRNVIEHHIANAPLAAIQLQQLCASDLEAYLATISAGSVGVHHAVLHKALRKAAKDRLLTTSPAVDLERKRTAKDPNRRRDNCWTPADARTFLDVAKTESPQVAAYMTLALDTGCRRGELNGVMWKDIDFDAATITIERQLDSTKLTAEGAAQFGPTKTKMARTIALGVETINRLRAHRKTQNELRLRSGDAYRNLGLVFAKEPIDLIMAARTRLSNREDKPPKLGDPIKTLAASTFRRLVSKAKVPSISFHGTRHTVATTLLNAGVPVHLVAQRLGHTSPVQTLTAYAHALAAGRQDAAEKLAEAFHGR